MMVRVGFIGGDCAECYFVVLGMVRLEFGVCVLILICLFDLICWFGFFGFGVLGYLVVLVCVWRLRFIR